MVKRNDGLCEMLCQTERKYYLLLKVYTLDQNKRVRTCCVRVCVRSVNKFVYKMCNGFWEQCAQMVLNVCMGCILFYLHRFCMKVAKAHTIFSSVQNMEGKMHKLRIVFRFVGKMYISRIII